MEKIRSRMEPNKKVRLLEKIAVILLIIATTVSLCIGFSKVYSDPGQFTYTGTVEMTRDRSLEDYDEDYTVCQVTYVNGEDILVVDYPYEE